MSLAPGQIALPPPPNAVGLVQTAPRAHPRGLVELLRGPGWDIPVADWRGLWSQRLFRLAVQPPEAVSTDPPRAFGNKAPAILTAEAVSTAPPSAFGGQVPGTLNAVPTVRPVQRVAPPVRTVRGTPQRGPLERLLPPPPERARIKPTPQERFPRQGRVTPPVVDDQFDAAVAWLEDFWRVTPSQLYARSVNTKDSQAVWLNLQESILASGFRSLWGEAMWTRILDHGRDEYLREQGEIPV